MLGWIVDFSSARVSDFAESRFPLSQRTATRHDDAHAGHEEVEPPARSVALRASAIRGDRRVMR